MTSYGKIIAIQRVHLCFAALFGRQVTATRREKLIENEKSDRRRRLWFYRGGWPGNKVYEEWQISTSEPMARRYLLEHSQIKIETFHHVNS